MMEIKQLPLKTRLGVSLGHAYPLLSGCGSFANSNLMKRFDPDEAVEIFVPVKGGNAYVPSDDYVGRAMLFVGDLDRKITKLVEACVEPGDVALDIGANLGLVSLQLAQRVGSKGAVHAFEPSPRLSSFLERTIKGNPTLNIVHHPIALGREKSELPLHVPFGNAGAATLKSDGQQVAETSVSVPVFALSEFADEIGLSRADFIKIDVEGFETEVIQGAVEFIKKSRPKVIVLEEHASVSDRSLPPALSALNDLSYELFALPKQLFRFQLVPLDQEGANLAHDYVAILNDESTRTIRRRLKLN